MLFYWSRMYTAFNMFWRCPNGTKMVQVLFMSKRAIMWWLRHISWVRWSSHTWDWTVRGLLRQKRYLFIHCACTTRNVREWLFKNENIKDDECYRYCVKGSIRKIHILQPFGHYFKPRRRDRTHFWYSKRLGILSNWKCSVYYFLIVYNNWGFQLILLKIECYLYLIFYNQMITHRV